MNAAMQAEFEMWWGGYPTGAKVGKLAAEREYERARQKATAQELLDGVTRYKQTKPAWKAWCNPRTFLSQGRWLDGRETEKPALLKMVEQAEPIVTVADARKRYDEERQRMAHEAWTRMCEPEQAALKARARQGLRTRYPLMTVTEDQVDRWCVLELAQAGTAKSA